MSSRDTGPAATTPVRRHSSRLQAKSVSPPSTSTTAAHATTTTTTHALRKTPTKVAKTTATTTSRRRTASQHDRYAASAGITTAIDHHHHHHHAADVMASANNNKENAIVIEDSPAPADVDQHHRIPSSQHYHVMHSYLQDLYPALHEPYPRTLDPYQAETDNEPYQTDNPYLFDYDATTPQAAIPGTYPITTSTITTTTTTTATPPLPSATRKRSIRDFFQNPPAGGSAFPAAAAAATTTTTATTTSAASRKKRHRHSNSATSDKQATPSVEMGWIECPACYRKMDKAKMELEAIELHIDICLQSMTAGGASTCTADTILGTDPSADMAAAAATNTTNINTTPGAKSITGDRYTHFSAGSDMVGKECSICFEEYGQGKWNNGWVGRMVG